MHRAIRTVGRLSLIFNIQISYWSEFQVSGAQEYAFWGLVASLKNINLVNGNGCTYLFMIHSEIKTYSRYYGVDFLTMHRAFTITIWFWDSVQ